MLDLIIVNVLLNHNYVKKSFLPVYGVYVWGKKVCVCGGGGVRNDDF